MQTSVTPSSPERPSASVDLSPLEAELYEILRRWRRHEASQQQLPLHWIATNATLAWLATLRPGNVEALAQVPGMGPARRELHATSLLFVLREACTRLGLPLADTVIRPPSQPRVWTPELEAVREAARQGFAAGRAVESIAAEIGARIATVERWLLAWVQEVRPATLRPWLDDATRERVREVAARLGRDKLKPIREAVDGEVPYLAIRLALLEP
jgi:ATP-dependent DNA helicase RecQ